MKSLSKKALAFLLAILSLAGLMTVAFSAAAAEEGYKVGDVIYVDYSALPEWHTGEDDTGWGAGTSVLYINFNANTRYDSGEKETVTIGEDTARFDPRTVTEKVKDCVYKYTVTEADAGKQTLRFWRGSETLLWNHSVELKYSDFSAGNNTVFISGYNSLAEGVGSIGVSEYFDYSLEAQLSITPSEDTDQNSYNVVLSYKAPIDAEVTYEYEIFVDGVSVGKVSEYTVTLEDNFTSVKGVITAYIGEKTVAKAEVEERIVLGGTVFSGAKKDRLYAHAVIGDSTDLDAWTEAEKNGSKYYFFLPSSSSETQVELYNTYSSEIQIGDFSIAPCEVKTFDYTVSSDYSVTGGAEFTLSFMRSGAEAALFVNNNGSVDGSLWNYLAASKANETSANAAITNADGTIDNTDLKKIKGRGNTTWAADKKPFNLNFKNPVNVGTMQTTKKYSLLANFQDAAMCRNRILYDLGDAVSLRYSCDSRFVDFYVDGVYMGQYQMSQKIEAGAENLVYEMEDDCYIDENGNLKDEFPLILELPYGEDFWTGTDTPIDVVIKSPDVEGCDYLYANEVKAYVRERFNQMYSAIKNNSSNLSDYINIESFAKAYLIQELGKNWDTQSWYLVYLPDENGVYKFEASPVWDFDNSIGNANGVYQDLEQYGVTDYTLPTGWWGQYKYGNNNMTYLCTQNEQIMEAAKTVWFKNFVPALEAFAGTGNTTKEILSQDVYYDMLAESAEMNYKKWYLLTDSGWVANHSKVTKASFDCETLTYTVDQTPTTYNQYTFKGQFDYMTDWLLTRAAWISNEWKEYYTAPEEVPDAPQPEPEPEPEPDTPVVLPDNTLTAFVFDSTGKVSGEKLTEYGSKEGYNATFGEGLLQCSVNSDGFRALEWSLAEYGESGKETVPLMTAGSKNPWGDSPYIQVTLSTKGYEDIGFTLTSAGSKKCPASWQLAYSLDGENFVDIENASFTIELDNRKSLITYFDDFKLPAEVNNQEQVILRLYAASNATVGGGTTADDPTGGEFVIENLIITGTRNQSTLPTEPSKPADTYILGDADNDRTVNVKDATQIQKHIANIDIASFNEDAADANEDGTVNVKDATEIQKYVASIPANPNIEKEFERK